MLGQNIWKTIALAMFIVACMIGGVALKTWLNDGDDDAGAHHGHDYHHSRSAESPTDPPSPSG